MKAVDKAVRQAFYIPEERFGDIKAIYEYRMPSLTELAAELRPLINDLLGESDAML